MFIWVDVYIYIHISNIQIDQGRDHDPPRVQNSIVMPCQQTVVALAMGHTLGITRIGKTTPTPNIPMDWIGSIPLPVTVDDDG